MDLVSSMSLYELVLLTLANVVATHIATMVRFCVKLLANVMFRKKIYKLHRHRELARRALERVERDRWFCEALSVFENRLVPHGWVVGKYFSMFASVDHGDEYANRTTITIYSWVWSRSGKSGVDDLANEHTHEIQVMRHSSCKLDETGYVKSVELACPLESPTREASMAAVEQMMGAWKRDGQGRFLLQGTPGCGKSTAARLLTQALGANALLFPSFDPTTPGENLSDMLRYVDHGSNTVVVVIEEFDVVLQKMMDKPVRAHKNLRIEVCDKASWNNMLDAIQFQSRLILVLTTNQTDEALQELDAGLGGGILRPGRITKRIRFPTSTSKKQE